MLAQLVENLIHLEGGEDRLDEHRRFDGAVRHAEHILGGKEDVVPEPGFEVALHLRQIEIRTRTGARQRLVVVGQIHGEIEQRARDRLTVHEDVLLRQMPAARAHDEGCRRSASR